MGCLCNKLAGPGVEVSPTCIGNLWVFENLKPEEMAALARAAGRKPYKRGQEVFAQGDPANRMFLIKAGRVKLSKISEAGNEITLDIRKAGDFLGESMLIEDADYPLTAACLEDTLICGFSKGDFEKLILENPNIGLQVIKNLSNRINWLTERVGSLSHQPGRPPLPGTDPGGPGTRRPKPPRFQHPVSPHPRRAGFSGGRPPGQHHQGHEGAQGRGPHLPGGQNPHPAAAGGRLSGVSL